MPRTIDSMIASRRAAQERIAAGKPVWDGKVRLQDLWDSGTMTFEQRRDAIVGRIRATSWFKGYDEFDELPQLVEELAGAVDQSEFNDAWDGIYDCADADRVWIVTR